MKQKTEVEMQLQKLSLRLRAEASIVRAEWLNQVLPAAITEFNRRLQNGEAIEVATPDIAGLIEQAVEQVQGAST